jgi:hypothetical protein
MTSPVHNKKRIIVCGYPKSGNTWLTRLIADVVNCPVSGFWCEPFNPEIAVEGGDRESEWICFKAHHSYTQLLETLNIYGNGTEKIVYIYRDPRAVATSACNYFDIAPKHRRLYFLLELLTREPCIYEKMFRHRDYAMDCIVSGLIHGTQHGYWMYIPWMKHIEEYLVSGTTMAVSYESLKHNPKSVMKQLCDFLCIHRDESRIDASISRQAFNSRKSKTDFSTKRREMRILRKGETDSWKYELPNRHILHIEKELGSYMAGLGYLPHTSSPVLYR